MAKGITDQVLWQCDFSWNPRHLLIVSLAYVRRVIYITSLRHSLLLTSSAKTIQKSTNYRQPLVAQTPIIMFRKLFSATLYSRPTCKWAIVKDLSSISRNYCLIRQTTVKLECFLMLKQYFLKLSWWSMRIASAYNQWLSFQSLHVFFKLCSFVIILYRF